MIKQSIDKSTKDIPTHFNSTWKGINFGNSKAIYRSTDWIEIFLQSVPSIVSPRFKDPETTLNVNKFVRASLLSIQWEITSSDLTEIKR